MTDLKTWLAEERGRSIALATHLGVSKARVSQIASGEVPRRYLLKIRDFTGGEVTLESLLSAPASKEQLLA